MVGRRRLRRRRPPSFRTDPSVLGTRYGWVAHPDHFRVRALRGFSSPPHGPRTQRNAHCCGAPTT